MHPQEIGESRKVEPPAVVWLLMAHAHRAPAADQAVRIRQAATATMEKALH
jgi:hypothetical protein